MIQTIIGDLRKSSFDLVSVSEPDLLKDDPSSKLIWQIFGAIADYEKTMIVLKLRGARARMRARIGRSEGAKPYGELPGVHAISERMKDLRSAGLGFDRISAALNAEGIRQQKRYRVQFSSAII